MQGSPHPVKRVIVSGKGVPVSHGSYSPAIVHGSTLYVSGQVAFDPATGELIDGDFRAQAERALANLLMVAAAAGAGASDALRVNVHLANLDDFATFDQVYRRHFSEPYPTRVTVGAALVPGLLIEVDAVFALADDADREGSRAK
jgi:2-iminobutanoate/2-iminopropanoate deaminase